MGCSGSPLWDFAASPSIVMIVPPFACTAKSKHERTVSPLKRIVQLPHIPCSQPRCVPVSARWSRRKSASDNRGSTTPSYRLSLTVISMAHFAVTVTSSRARINISKALMPECFYRNPERHVTGRRRKHSRVRTLDKFSFRKACCVEIHLWLWASRVKWALQRHRFCATEALKHDWD